MSKSARELIAPPLVGLQARVEVLKEPRQRVNRRSQCSPTTPSTRSRGSFSFLFCIVCCVAVARHPPRPSPTMVTMRRSRPPCRENGLRLVFQWVVIVLLLSVRALDLPRAEELRARALPDEVERVRIAATALLHRAAFGLLAVLRELTADSGEGQDDDRQESGSHVCLSDSRLRKEMRTGTSPNPHASRKRFSRKRLKSALKASGSFTKSTNHGGFVPTCVP